MLHLLVALNFSLGVSLSPDNCLILCGLAWFLNLSICGANVYGFWIGSLLVSSVILGLVADLVQIAIETVLEQTDFSVFLLLKVYLAENTENLPENATSTIFLDMLDVPA